MFFYGFLLVNEGDDTGISYWLKHLCTVTSSVMNTFVVPTIAL